MDRSALTGSFSTPIGGGQLYPTPPYLYRGIESITVAYETDRQAAQAFLPPHVTVADDPAVCYVWAVWYPFSTFGPYQEAYIMIRVVFEGQTYLYQPFIFTDSEVPLAAGREIWGYAKKLAVMERHQAGAGGHGEQMLFAVERPRGKRIMTVTLACDRLGDPAELPAYPPLSLRVIPNCEAGKPPSVAELVCVDAVGRPHYSADGSPQLFEGRASVTMDSPSEVDPWYRLAPSRIIKGWFGLFDGDLPHGRRLHNYLDEPALWGH